jgi:hypothetical protein
MVIAVNMFTLSRNVNTCKTIWQSGSKCGIIKVLPLSKVAPYPGASLSTKEVQVQQQNILLQILAYNYNINNQNLKN